MKYLLTIGLFIILSSAHQLIAQEITLDSKSLLIRQNPAFKAYLQGDGRFLALDTYRLGFIKRNRFFVGDQLTFKSRNERGKIREKITAITDSSFSYSTFNEIINEFQHTEIPLRNVRKIRLSRRIPWVSQGTLAFPIAGLMFSITDLLSVRDGQFRDPKAILIGGGIASLGLVCWKLSHPSYRLGKRHRLRVLRVQ
ncbi:MAG: hypothetical protein EAZ14_01400 [Runella slithyformis]|jgi:hypothetical protein|nr:MAG: hypothetical protein EAZ46_10945 [Runella sp.]TAG18692.1 MAG: hypothetical protein EAZ38_14235 [Cytophagales bacterium]TAG38242.1 MAG: hypothetical protein EAZ32_13065 [Cytophagia bacterium]TAG57041.1 MAG: hypothetical protein EAZ29_02480 [Runella slithyformis]TAG79624.1 MAG: hypothetical protein EAZ22_11215 [Cytophagales bacterium]